MQSQHELLHTQRGNIGYHCGGIDKDVDTILSMSSWYVFFINFL